MGEPWEATKVSLNFSKPGKPTIKEHFFKAGHPLTL